MAATINLELLKRLCEAHGVAGREDSVRALVHEELEPLVDDISTDALGNLIGVRRGNGGPRVLIAGHLDEIGFLVKHIDADGFLRLQPVGGFDPSRLPAQRVIVHGFAGGRHRGSIGVAGKPIHLQTPGEVKPVTIDDLFVDIGLNGEQAHAQVEVGDMVTFDRTLETSGNYIMTKSLDDRVGVFIMLEALKALAGPVQAEVIAVATTQEEVGTRGAMTVAWSQAPDIAIALDITPAGDFPGAPPEFVAVKLGAGVALKIMDVTAISDYALNQRLRRIADAEGIPYQLEILGRGGTDAGVMQRSRGGVPVTALSVPVRYAHTPNETCSTNDIQAAIDLVARFLERAHLSA
ncbi:MAG: endoglucanase [Chloroflexi bacterium]|nr:MAG: endoglucanase [Chloroflexota bacterium]